MNQSGTSENKSEDQSRRSSDNSIIDLKSQTKYTSMEVGSCLV